MDTFAAMEMDFLLKLQSLHNPVLDAIMVFVTKLGDAGFIWIILAIVLILIKKTRYCGVTMLFGMALGALLGEVVIKNLVQRLRPCHINETIALIAGVPDSFSFPSGHTCASFCAATVLFVHKKWAGICAFLLAVFIAFSRMYLFVHFPTDVLAGILLGVASAAIALFIFKKLRKHIYFAKYL